MKEIHYLLNTNNMNIDYKMRSHIAYKFIIVMDCYDRDRFIQYFLQVTRCI